MVGFSGGFVPADAVDAGEAHRDAGLVPGRTVDAIERDFDDPFGGSMIASAGLEAGVGPGTISVGYRGRFGDQADSHVGAITFRLPLQ